MKADTDGRRADTEGDSHDTSWSAQLEDPSHAADRDRFVREAIEALESTAEGVHVNLVTHGEHGHPESYLFPELETRFGDAVDWEFVDHCDCGGYVMGYLSHPEQPLR